MFKAPEDHRVRVGNMRTTEEHGNNGVFKIIEGYRSEVQIVCIASDQNGWENVSVAVKKNGKTISPTHGQMQKVKELFWEAEDCVMQFYPPKSQSPKKGSKILYLWRKAGENFAVPMG